MAAPTQQTQEKVPSEDIIAHKTDLCISNAIVKTGIGFGTGVVLSVLLFKRRAFPVWLGTGWGLGSAYTDCERSFNPYSGPGLRVVPPSSSSPSSAPSTALERLSQRAGEAVDSAKKYAQPKLQEAKEEVSTKGKEVKETVENKVRQV